MILLDLCAVCNCLAFSDKTNKVIINNTILFDTCPDSSLNNPLKVYCVPSVKLKQLKDCGLLGQYQMMCPDDIPVELAALSLDEIRIISLICPFLKVIILPGG